MRMKTLIIMTLLSTTLFADTIFADSFESNQLVFSWSDCTLISAIGYETTTPETYSIHCEDPKPMNDDYFIDIEDNVISIDSGGTEPDVYRNCEIVYFRQLFTPSRIKVDFETVCFVK